MDRLKEDTKNDEEKRHMIELNSLKEQYRIKSEFEKERIREETIRLIEESGDLDRQIELFRSEQLENKIDD